MKSKVIKVFEWGFVILTFLLLLYRITLHADVSDEIMNLSISYRITQGDLPFYHIQEAYQIGAIFTAPFVWLFVKLTGGTEGIILYSRVIYILALIGCAMFMWHLLKRYLRKDIAFFLSYIIVFFELFSLFYLWYDSEAVIFCLLGNIFIAKALEQSARLKKRYAYLAIAGIVHCCMAAAHVALIPMAVGTALCLGVLVFFHYEKQISAAVKCVFAYASVPLAVLVLGFLLVLFTGNLVTVVEFLKGLLLSRGVGEFHLWETLWSVAESYFSVNPCFLKGTILLLLLYPAVLIFPKLFPLLALGITALPIYNQFVLPHTSVRGVPNYLSYIALWGVLLYLLIRKKETFDRCLLYIFWIPQILAVLFIPLFSLTSSYGPIKAWQMCLPGALAALYYMVRVWKEKSEESFGICKLLFMAVSLTLLYGGYSFVFLNQPAVESQYKRMEEGIYKGIKVNPDMECMAELQQMIKGYSDGCETILASSGIRPIYLMTDLRPFTRTTESATFFDGDVQRWGRQLEYFERFQNIPDIMFLEYYDLQDIFFEEVLYKNYELLAVETIGKHEIYVYKRIVQ